MRRVLIENAGKLLFKATISGETYSKANSRKVAADKTTGRRLFIKSDGAREYCNSFFMQMLGRRRPPETIDCRLILVCRIYYASERKDLDESLIMDMLQKTGIIRNDRLIREKHIYHFIDKNNPRSEIKLFELTN